MYTPLIITMLIAATIVMAAIKENRKQYQQRKMLQFDKIIYNYACKTQQQVYEILELELRMLHLPGYEIDHFSEPIFKSNGSALYVVYLKKRKSNPCE